MSSMCFTSHNISHITILNPQSQARTLCPLSAAWEEFYKEHLIRYTKQCLLHICSTTSCIFFNFLSEIYWSRFISEKFLVVVICERHRTTKHFISILIHAFIIKGMLTASLLEANFTLNVFSVEKTMALEKQFVSGCN